MLHKYLFFILMPLRIYMAQLVLCIMVQSTHMASKRITEEAIYLCTGNPMPKDIEQIAFWLLNESFTESFKCILQCLLSLIL